MTDPILLIDPLDLTIFLGLWLFIISGATYIALDLTEWFDEIEGDARWH